MSDIDANTQVRRIYGVKCGFIRSINGNSKTMKFSKQFQLYESEATQFINSLKQSNPALEQSQSDGRALLWDKAPLDPDTQRRASESLVEQQAYVYQSKH